MNRGYIKLWRKSLDSGLLQNAQVWQFMCWCLLKAAHKAHKRLVGHTLVELNPGQLVFGRTKAAQELESTERKIRTCIDILKKADFLTIKTTNKFSIISIVNWDTYQDERPADDQQADQETTSKRPADDHKQTCKEYINKYSSLRSEYLFLRGAEKVGPALAVVDEVLPEAVPDACLEKFISLPLNDGTEHAVTVGEVEQWQDLYQAVDVRQELRNMLGWMLGNPRKRKTKRGIGRFIHSWLSRAQDVPRSNVSRSPLGGGPPVATTQHQADRQNQISMARFVLAAKELERNGDIAENSNGTGTNEHAFPPADERGGVERAGPGLGRAVQRFE